MAYRLLVLDLDGTLLTPQDHISPANRRAVAAALARGVVVTLATARRWWSVAPFVAELGLTVPVILYDGGLICDTATQQTLYRNCLAASVAREVIDRFLAARIQPVIQLVPAPAELSVVGPVELDSPSIRRYMSESPVEKQRASGTALYPQGDPIRIVGFDDLAKLQTLAESVAGLECRSVFTPRGSFGQAELSVMHPTCSKAQAMLAFAQLHGIAREETVAIGDGYNDIEMLETAGLGIAMGNAPDPVKQIAAVVTASNAEDGVAQAIERFLLS